MIPCAGNVMLTQQLCWHGCEWVAAGLQGSNPQTVAPLVHARRGGVPWQQGALIHCMPFAAMARGLHMPSCASGSAN